jgi:hypothetical protein
MGRGGWRNAPHPVQRWISSLCSRNPFQKNSVSGLIAGASRDVISVPA